MKLYITNSTDRDNVVLALTRNGYTVRPGKEKPTGAKTSVIFVEVTGRGTE